VWDLHYPTPNSARHEYPISAVPHDTPRNPRGPRALPSSYSVRLTVDGKSFTSPLIVKLDPRVKTSTAALQQQFDLEVRLASLLNNSSEALLQARSIREQLSQLSEKASGSAKDQVEKLEKKLTSVLGATPEANGPQNATLSRVNSSAYTLYAEVDRADAAPTAAQIEATSATEGDAATVLKEWEEIKTHDLPALNDLLHGGNLPTLELEANPHSLDEGDEE